MIYLPECLCGSWPNQNLLNLAASDARRAVSLTQVSSHELSIVHMRSPLQKMSFLRLRFSYSAIVSEAISPTEINRHGHLSLILKRWFRDLVEVVGNA